MSTEVKRCECKSDFQDEEYGHQQRLMNLNEKGGMKCTICGAVHRNYDSPKKK